MTHSPKGSSEKDNQIEYGHYSTYKTSEKERVFRKTSTKTLEVIDRPFTTEAKRHRKRGPHIVRRRARRYIAVLKQKYGITNEIPLEQAKHIFQEEMDIWDCVSLKAYFGTQETFSRRKIQRVARYASTGTMSFKTIELTQPIKHKQGYLERLGLVSYEKRGNTWFLTLRKGETVIPVLARKSNQESESLEANSSIPNLSLTPKQISRIEHASLREGTGTVLEVPELRKSREEREL